MVIQEFLNCLREDKQPPFDVYFATRMAALGILAHRSQLERGVPYDIPDFRKEEDRAKWGKDTLTPFYGLNGEAPTLPCSSHPDYQPSPESDQAYLDALENRQ